MRIRTSAHLKTRPMHFTALGFFRGAVLAGDSARRVSIGEAMKKIIVTIAALYFTATGSTTWAQENAQYLGFWRGGVEKSTQAYSVELLLEQNEQGFINGFIAYPELNCWGRISYRYRREKSILLNELVKNSPRCASSGVITLAPVAADTLNWVRYNFDNQRDAISTLTRAQPSASFLALLKQSRDDKNQHWSESFNSNIHFIGVWRAQMHPKFPFADVVDIVLWETATGEVAGVAGLLGKSRCFFTLTQAPEQPLVLTIETERGENCEGFASGRLLGVDFFPRMLLTWVPPVIDKTTINLGYLIYNRAQYFEYLQPPQYLNTYLRMWLMDIQQ